MTATSATPDWHRDPVITTIRAELARRGIRPAALPQLLGFSQAYWARRLIADTDLSVSDLRLLADLLEVPVASFFAEDDKAPRPEPGGQRARRDSNPQPSEVESLPLCEDPQDAPELGQLAQVLDLARRRRDHDTPRAAEG